MVLGLQELVIIDFNNFFFTVQTKVFPIFLKRFVKYRYLCLIID